MSENEILPSPTAGPSAAGSEEKSAASSWFGRIFDFVGEIFHIVIISLAIIVPIRYFLIQPFYVKGASMEPNFYDHEYLIIDEISYRFSVPRRGDVVVFRYPNDPRQFFIKRIVGLPGEWVRVGDSQVFISPDGQDWRKLDESGYLGERPTAGQREARLNAGEYFLLGDNRGSSLDSRVFGAVPANLIVGRVWLRGWPPEKLAVFGSPGGTLPVSNNQF